MKSKSSKNTQPKFTPERDERLVYGWDGIGRHLGVSFMTARRWAVKDESLAKVIRVFSRTPLSPGKFRHHVRASKADLDGWMKSKPWLFDILPRRAK